MAVIHLFPETEVNVSLLHKQNVYLSCGSIDPNGIKYGGASLEIS